MSKRWIVISLVAAAFLAGYLVANREPPVQGQEGEEGATRSFSAVPDDVGAIDVTGPYDVVEGWPKDISTLPGNEKWTWGAGQGVFAESPNRVHLHSARSAAGAAADSGHAAAADRAESDVSR